ncbi:hypothetical protein [Caminibacter sp.]
MVSLFFIFFTFASTSILYKNKNICIEDYYYKNGYFYYKKSSDGYWYKTWTSNNNLEYGYYYDSDNKICEYNQTLKELGVTYDNYNFLIGLVAVLAGFTFLFWSVFIFIDVAKK